MSDKTVETLQEMIANGWMLRMQEIDHKVIVSANHFIWGRRVGIGNSLEEAVQNMKEHEE